MTMTTNPSSGTDGTDVHATTGAVLAQLRDKMRAVEACEKLLGQDALHAPEALGLFARVAKNDARDTQELEQLLGKLHVSGHGPSSESVTRAAATATSTATEEDGGDDAHAIGVAGDEETERLPARERNATSRTKE